MPFSLMPKILLMVAVMVASLMSPAPLSQAKAQDSVQDEPPVQLQDLRKIAAFTQKAQTVYLGYMDLITLSSNIDDLAYGLISEDISRKYADAKIKAFSAEFQNKAKHLKLDTDNLAPATSKLGKFDQISVAMVAYLRKLHDQINDLHLSSVEFYQQAQKGLSLDESDFSSRKLDQMAIVLEGENQLISIQIGLKKDDTPEYYNLQTIMAGNLAAISMVQGLKTIVTGQKADQIHFAEARKHVVHMRDYIHDGRILTNDMVRKFKFELPTDAAERKRIGYLVEAIQTYHETFDNEVRTADIIVDMLDEFENNAQQASFDQIMADIALKMETATNTRMLLYSKRNALVAKMAN